MFSKDVCDKLENIIQGVVIEESQDTCTTVRNHLCSRYTTSATVKAAFESKQPVKKDQAQYLQQLAIASGLMLPAILSEWAYLTRGGESSVYLNVGNKSVIKLNDAIYYATWLEYFNSLLIHNLLFPNTSYTLIGFMIIEDVLYAVLEQPFIISSETADIQAIKELLEFNGFRNTKRQDYFNEQFGLILEDMHDENVILQQGSLFFIDTVFYITAQPGDNLKIC